MSASVLAIILLAGYVYTSRAVNLRPRTMRYSGWHLYLFCFAWGFLLFLLSIALFAFLKAYYPLPIELACKLFEEYAIYLPKEVYSLYVALFFTLLLSYVLLLITNLPLFILGGICNATNWIWLEDVRWRIEKLNLKYVLKHSKVDRIIVRSAENRRPLLVTLNNEKVYVGLTINTPDPESNAKYITLMKWYSGYRKADKTIEYTTDYSRFYGELSESGYDGLTVSIPVDTIVSIGFFDETVHEALHDSDFDD